MKTQRTIATLIAILVLTVLTQGCGKKTASDDAGTGYPAISVKCGGETCVK